MKKIFKKSLAIMVSAAICLTALIGCLSVSAANGDAPVYTVATVEGKKGETVDVKVTGDDLTKICGQDLSIIFAKGLTIGTVHDNIINEDLTCDPEGDGMQYNVIANDDGTNTVKMVDIINFPEYGEGESYNPPLVTGTLDVTISVTIPADAAADTEYPITINESQFADYEEEEWVYPILNNGKITVVEDVSEPVLDESLPLGRQVYVGSQFGLYYAIPQSSYSQYDNFYIEVISEHYDESYNITSTTERIYKNEIANTISGIDYYLYSGTTGYEMLLKIKATVYIEDSTGKVIKYSPTKEDTLVERVKSGVTSEVAKQDKDLKLLKVYLDMVNFATEAEKYFAEQYPDSALASSVNDGKLSNIGFEDYQIYASSESIDAKDINNTVYDSINNPNQSVKLGKQVTIGASNFIAYQINPGDFDTSKITLSVKYTDSYGNNLDKEVSYTDLAETGNWFRYTDIALYDVSKTITAVVSYDGNTLVTNEYSIESAAARNSDPNTTAIFDLIMKFGYSCNDYLSSGFASN